MAARAIARGSGILLLRCRRCSNAWRLKVLTSLRWTGRLASSTMQGIGSERRLRCPGSVHGRCRPMIEGWSVVALALGYVSILFAVAWYADRADRFSKSGSGRPLIYALSLAVYCTSWTFFGSVGNAASTGYDFIPVYLGPILLFVLGWPFLLRIVRLAKSQNITSVADFLAARYGKSQAVAAIVTVIAVAGTLPYIALQLTAVALSVNALLGPATLGHLHIPTDTALVIALAMAA